MKLKHTQKKESKRPWSGVLPHKQLVNYYGHKIPYMTTLKQPNPTYKNI